MKDSGFFLFPGSGLNPHAHAYFAPGGRYNMRRKSDCGGRGGGTAGAADAGMLPDLAQFQQKMRRNRSLDRTNELETFSQQQQQQQMGASSQDLRHYQRQHQQHQHPQQVAAGRGWFG